MYTNKEQDNPEIMCMTNGRKITLNNIFYICMKKLWKDKEKLIKVIISSWGDGKADRGQKQERDSIA